MYGERFRQLADRIPKEVGFVNFSGLDYGVLPGCTYISQRHDLAGVAAVDLIMGQLSRNERGWPENPNCVIVPSEWPSSTTTQNQRDDDGLPDRKSRGKQCTANLSRLERQNNLPL
jgi:hypothetical protein